MLEQAGDMGIGVGRRRRDRKENVAPMNIIVAGSSAKMACLLCCRSIGAVASLLWHRGGIEGVAVTEMISA